MKRFAFLLSLPLLASVPGCDDSPSNDSSDAQSGSSGGTTGAASTDPSDPTTDPTSATNPSASGTTTGDPSTSGPDSETGETTDETSDPSETDGDTTGATECGGDVPCEDAMILDLGLVGGVVSAGAVSSTADGDDWVSNVDATAGGIVDAPNNPWVYLRFADDGLEKLDLDDLQALSSDEWHIAAKRFGIRLNSGSSGPGCVTVATLDADYADVDALPDDAQLDEEAFYDGSCGLIDDGSGAGGANYALTPWWFYPGCVGVTYVPFVIEIEDGQHVKFMVESYYESGQQQCNDTGAMGSGSANFVWRWSFLD